MELYHQTLKLEGHVICVRPQREERGLLRERQEWVWQGVDGRFLGSLPLGKRRACYGPLLAILMRLRDKSRGLLTATRSETLLCRHAEGKTGTSCSSPQMGRLPTGSAFLMCGCSVVYRLHPCLFSEALWPLGGFSIPSFQKLPRL